MHGIIMAELQKYVESTFDSATWNELLSRSGLSDRFYLPIQEYPDDEAVAIVSAASAMIGVPEETILLEYGEFIASDLIDMYKMFIKPEWTTLDLLEQTEGTIHSVVRIRNPGARPPELQTSRPSPDVVHITYTSPRKMCAVAKGIAKGISHHYEQEISITESACMLKGDPSCEMSFRLLK